MTASEVKTVQVGQIWADNDWRCKGRTVKIIAIDPTDLRGERRATVEVVTPPESGVQATVGKQTRVLLRRFRPNSTGYRLIKDVD